MSTVTKTQKRWMKSVLQTSTQTMPALPFKRGQRFASASQPGPATRLLRSA